MGNNTSPATTIQIKACNASFTACRADGASALPGGAVPGLQIKFTDTSTGSPTAWSWDFGDGGADTTQNPTHTYNQAGYWTVTLKASNAIGSDIHPENNLVVACTEMDIYPGSTLIPSWASAPPNNEHVVSGGPGA